MSAIALTGAGLRVRFEKQGDRFRHVVDVLDGGQFVPLLESLEGTPDEDWPASPPLQSLHIEERAAGRSVALLVGMAGGSHWSLSVELDPAVGQLTWDVACRVRQPPEFLGSRYRVLGNSQIASDAGGWRFARAGQNWDLRTEVISHEPLPRCDFETGRITIAAATPTVEKATTVRWCYRLRPSPRPA